MFWKSLVTTAAAFGLGSVAALFASGPPLGRGLVEQVSVSTMPVALDRTDPAASRVGKLVYMGGIALKSDNKRFGGLSALLWEPECKRLLAVSDTGVWLILEPAEEADRLIGLVSVWMAPVLDEAGAAPRDKAEADAESLGRMGDETFVWFEQDHRAQRYRGVSACRPETLATPAHAVARPAAIQAWPRNGGVEASAVLGSDILLISEAFAAGGAKAAVRWTPRSDTGVVFGYASPKDFEPTGMALRDSDATNGKMLVLHRRFSPLGGLAAMLGEADMTGAQEGMVIAPRELAMLRPPLAIDNMEGLAVRAEGTRRFVYLVSDDNFNPLQRTLLLKFELVE